MKPTSNSPNRPSISIIVPTYREAENLPGLIERVEAVIHDAGLDAELLVMDDDSQDGTEEAIASLARPWVRLVVRKENRGLSAAVLDGFAQAEKDVLLVMDADLSHPPEKIPEMLDALGRGRDFVVGSRYVPGGSTDEEWGVFRWINSRVATLLARPFTSVRDPMSGFFALRRDRFQAADALSPIGYKIGLELLVKCHCRDVEEVPIHFSQRQFGESKLSFAEQVRYLQHLHRLFLHKFGNWAHFLLFGAVGTSGVFVNLAVLTVLLALAVPLKLAVAVAIFVPMLTNFALNRRFNFTYAREGSVWRQLGGFIAASSVGALVNFCVTLFMVGLGGIFEAYPQTASVVGIVSGLIFNFFASRYLVFIKPK